ncbi:Alcohol dehydrogenase superfamily protein [Mycena indigotica]|uniref:Alcohol dehydrogenase superfamily protein n=1 Tax=Mycena indigotica TaxID=2126181 RepID=A0A8H6T896_9AGAR|nr:Alcohol dehydrogenase superfamily protein [Mycena indigotica]KAF7311772.1 Alcohol dehydrogenase superfamily protein [Mycena indigotica]
MAYPESARAYVLAQYGRVYVDGLARRVGIAGGACAAAPGDGGVSEDQGRFSSVPRPNGHPWRVSAPQNLTPGSDMAGEVVALGPDAKGWALGDRVTASFFLHRTGDNYNTDIMNSALGAPVSGVLREYCAFPAHSLVAVPEHLSFEEAATLPCAGVTAYNALFGGPRPLTAGETVLIQGTGGVSIFALQLVIAAGAQAIVISSSDEKLAVAKRLGAAHGINYSHTPAWDEELKKLTGGQGVDRVVEMGGNTTLERSLSAVKTGGHIHLIGQLGGIDDVPAVSVVVPAIWKELHIRGNSIGSVAHFRCLLRVLAARPEMTRPVIDRVFDFADARAALQYVGKQQHVGKVVVRM